MPELQTLDVENYTQGRLNKDDAQTGKLLSAALGAARRYCGWHVTPVREDDEVTLDGPASSLLVLPTLKLVELGGIVEDGEPVDLNYVSVSTRGVCRKKYGAPNGHCWTGEYSGVTVTMTHGYDTAPDWESAVLSLVDRMAQGGELTTIGPFGYQTDAVQAGSMFSDTERMILDMYRLESAP